MECIILSPPLQKEKGQAVKLKNYHIAFGIWEGEFTAVQNKLGT
jgi:hypothetical protein